jgi:hypothetical protein
MRRDPVRDKERPADALPALLSATHLLGWRLLQGIFPTARMSRSTDMVIATGGLGSKVLYDTRDKDAGYDDGQLQTGSEICDLTNDEIVLRYAGWWKIWAVHPFSSSTAGTVRQGYFNVDRGVGYGLLLGSKRTMTPVGGGNPTIVYVSVEDQFAAGDKIEVRAYQDSGGNLSILTVEGILVGATWLGL